MDENDLMNPAKNDLIVTNDPQITEEEILAGDLIPDQLRTPQEPGFVLEKLENADNIEISGILINRLHKHGDGEAGGEEFLISLDGNEKKVQLSQLARVQSVEELKSLFEQD